MGKMVEALAKPQTESKNYGLTRNIGGKDNCWKCGQKIPNIKEIREKGERVGSKFKYDLDWTIYRYKNHLWGIAGDKLALGSCLMWCSECGRKMDKGYCCVHGENKGITKQEAEKKHIGFFKQDFSGINKEVIESAVYRAGEKDFTEESLNQACVDILVYSFIESKSAPSVNDDRMVSKEEIINYDVNKTFYTEEKIDEAIKWLMRKGYIFAPKKDEYKTLV